MIAAYAEYDAVPGNSQEPVPVPNATGGTSSEQAAGHTDPHSALGTGALAGVLAAKAAMERHRLTGTLVFFGEPAEKVCGSKPVHAAHGLLRRRSTRYHLLPRRVPCTRTPRCWETHCGSYWSALFTFECMEPETWTDQSLAPFAGSSHAVARAPAATTRCA